MVLLPIAAGVLYPILGVSVVTNSLRRRHFRPAAAALAVFVAMLPYA